MRKGGTFAEFLAHPGVREQVVLRGRFGFMAFHAGLELATDLIAREAAEAAGASLYVAHQPEDLRWHISSQKVTADQSPALACFLDHVDAVIAVHGFGRPHLFRSVVLGGRHRPMAEHVAVHLYRHLRHYEVVHRIDEVPARLRGLHPSNPVNVVTGGGVQLELPPRLRGLVPPGRIHPWPHRDHLIAALADAARAWEPRPAGDQAVTVVDSEPPDPLW